MGESSWTPLGEEPSRNLGQQRSFLYASVVGIVVAMCALSAMWTESWSYDLCVCPLPINKYLGIQEASFTVMITLNHGYVDFFHAWYEQYKKLALPFKVLIVAEDDHAYHALQRVYPSVDVERGHINASNTGAAFGSQAYKEMMAARATHMLRHLTVGKSLLFADVDAFWITNPLLHFSPEFDVWMPVEKPLNWPFRTHAYHNAGFMGMRSNARTIRLVQNWEKELTRLGATRNQRVLHDLLVEDLDSGRADAVRLQSLPHMRFPSGYTYFNRGCKLDAAVVHANGPIKGHDMKLKVFRAEGLWTDMPIKSSNNNKGGAAATTKGR